MNFFINKGLFEREWNFEITSVNGKTQFSIPEYVEKKRRHYQLYFLFDRIVSTEDLKENFFLKNVTMEKVRKDMYYLAKNTEKIMMESMLYLEVQVLFQMTSSFLKIKRKK